MTPLLSVKDLRKTYGGRVGCTDVSFDLYPGEVMGIVGESGSGKSTLLNCMAGHLPVDHGQVLFDTRHQGLVDTLSMPEPERRMLSRTDWAFVHQHARDGLRMSVSAGGNVGERLMAVGQRHYGKIRQEASDWLELKNINFDATYSDPANKIESATIGLAGPGITVSASQPDAGPVSIESHFDEAISD